MYVAFERPDHLLAALHTVTPAGKLLRPTIQRLADLWVLPVKDLVPNGSVELVETLAAQYGWSVSFPERVRETETHPTGDLLTHCEWVSPQHGAALMLPNQNEGIPTSVWRLSGTLHPSVPFRPYLLGVREGNDPQALLDALALCRIQGIYGTPVILDPIPGQPRDAATPFRFFWKIFAQRPVPLLFDRADAVWYGPFDGSLREVAIYLRYPFSLTFPLDLLRRIPFRDKTQVALLGPEEMMELVPRNEEGVFQPFPGIVRLKAANVTIPPPESYQPAPVDPNLTVTIQFQADNLKSRLKTRIAALERQVDVSKRLIKQLLDSVDEIDKTDVPEPLHIFVQPPAHASRLPPELQQLIAEWSDRPADLGALGYLLLDHSALPATFSEPGSGLHLVASAAALGLDSPQGESDRYSKPQGEPDGYSVGSRLLSYAPRTAASRSFLLDRKWADSGFRLFVPQNSNYVLYPNLRPSHKSAERYADAVLADVLANVPGQSKPDPKSFIFLLLNVDGLPHFIVVPRDSFRRMDEAFQWHMKLDARFTEAAMKELPPQSILDAVVDKSVHDAAWKSQLDKLETYSRAQGQNLDPTDKSTVLQNLETAVATINAEIRRLRSSPSGSARSG